MIQILLNFRKNNFRKQNSLGTANQTTSKKASTFADNIGTNKKKHDQNGAF